MARSWRDDDVVAAWSGLLRLHAELVPVIDHELQETAGMPLGWYDVLLELDAAPQKRLRMSDLGAAAVLSRTRVSRVVDELVRIGHVERVSNPNDARSAFAALTPWGRAAFRRAAPRYLDSVRRHLGARLSRADALELRRILDVALSDSTL
ncbi:MAG: MarR family transcriptional regulator [Acidimicrobiales bacterium]